jgi:nucleoside-diphosphate-sugar epimerase
LLEAAQLALKLAGGGTLVVKGKDADFPSRGALNIDAARKDFGYTPKVDVEEGFERYYEWLSTSSYWQDKIK